ncbi:protein-disulfide reductase DsbD family protein [Pectobacteriaceae bacterium CE70]|nr:protein-disulfide reductase DsbD family protein [Pectobacteriaceae bacterium CE70]WJY10940.1 protein-disulfide reductase DsbD family protein [Pectobacteriaceae bacterium C80]
MYIFIRRFFLLLLFSISAAQAADTGWLQDAQNSHAQVRVRADTSKSDLRVLLDVRLAPGWKTYWRSPGDGGVAPKISWQDHLTAKWFWPVPTRSDISGLTTQGYHGHVTIPMVMTEKHLTVLAGTLTLPTCSNVCILTDYPFRLDLSLPNDKSFDDDFTRAMGRVPSQSGMMSDVKASYTNGKLLITAENPRGWKAPEVFLDSLSDASLGKPVTDINGHHLKVTVPVTDAWGDTPPDLTGQSLSLVIADQDMAQHSKTLIARAQMGNVLPFWNILLMALAGGLILNLMPCVLPVLGMKLGSVLHADNRVRGNIRIRFLATTAGIMVSFMALALLMTSLRLSHSVIGWGLQFQSPWFIAFMVLITFLFSLNLFDVFYFALPSALNSRLATVGGRGIAGNFCEGVFATLLATPCSAPFLGTAVAFALAAPLTQLWVVFLALGLGMSFPWLLVALWPAMAMWLPGPGRWMNWLRTGLGLMMFGSCLWLLSLINVYVGTDIVIMIAVFMVLLTAILIGKKTQNYARMFYIALLLVMFMSGYLTKSLIVSGSGVSQKEAREKIAWQPLSEEAINQALMNHKRVFIDVTADWCITCKVNELRVLDREDVRQALQQDDVVALRGDWTKPAKEITDFLKRRGRVAVPFNQIYGPGKPDGVVLPPLLDSENLLKTLNAAKGTR